MKPFNLEDALAGKAVKLRSGQKAYVRHHETEFPVDEDMCLMGFLPDGTQMSWCESGHYFRPDETDGSDIIGMYPETHVINGFEVPLPTQVAPSYYTEYYIPLPTGLYFYDNLCWSDDAYDERVLQRGLVFLNKEDAIATAKAMLGIDPYSKEKKNETI